MKKIIRLLLLAPFWLACQSSDPAVFGVEPDYVAYNDEAPLLKKSFCGDAKCKNPNSEERYTYGADGKLSKVEIFARTTSAVMELQSYTDYIFDANGLMTGKVQYSKHGLLPGWVAYNESEFEYQGGLLIREKTYFNQHQPEQKVFTGAVEYQYQNGKKTGQKWTDDHNEFIRRVQYGYKNDVVNRETWYDQKDNVIRIFEHKFSGNRRQIGEYLLNSTELLAMIEKTYDEKGRLATQETKVNNPLLCAMAPGLIRYSY
ncbi:hypothetical protein [Dyadobacter pollutisoli]|uniref:Toxin-antitoxin system YwqK family antitoxin n=1 Tax=Dyadobacter pollutisoli TaxID=2910158 RepID=A0A9E8NAJ8_9BACT|nr:hypothetical protein [Dyadobacter pollutisoli]WAC12995.1 hypothetical protein ON006_03320 [Dyadobacter pollutisoli]